MDELIWTDEDGVEWLNDSEDRYQTLEKRVRRKPPKNAKECLKALQRPVANACTCQSMGMHPATGDLCLRTIRLGRGGSRLKGSVFNEISDSFGNLLLSPL